MARRRRYMVVSSRWLVATLLGVTVTLLLGQAQGASAEHDAVIIDGMPSVKQSYNLSCEFAAASAVTRYWGSLVSEDEFLQEVPESPNPHKGFRGDINGVFGGIDDYGVYAEPLVPVLERRGYDATVFYGNVERLKAEIDEEHPVVVWITTGRYVERPSFRREYQGETFKLVQAEHTVVVYGYDGDGVYIMDVSDGGFYHTPWDSFLMRWGYFDQMALAMNHH